MHDCENNKFCNMFRNMLGIPLKYEKKKKTGSDLKPEEEELFEKKAFYKCSNGYCNQEVKAAKDEVTFCKSCERFMREKHYY